MSKMVLSQKIFGRLPFASFYQLTAQIMYGKGPFLNVVHLDIYTIV
jgi:hypothetical protein